MTQTIDLQDRVASVTGAGPGMGLSIAYELARAGAHIAVLELDDGSARAAADALTGAHGVTAVAVPTDVRERAALVDHQRDATRAAVLRVGVNAGALTRRQKHAAAPLPEIHRTSLRRSHDERGRVTVGLRA